MAIGTKTFEKYCNYFTTYNKATKERTQDKKIKVIFLNAIEGKKGKFHSLSIQFEDGTEVTGTLKVKQKPIVEE